MMSERQHPTLPSSDFPSDQSALAPRVVTDISTLELDELEAFLRAYRKHNEKMQLYFPIGSAVGGLFVTVVGSLLFGSAVEALFLFSAMVIPVLAVAQRQWRRQFLMEHGVSDAALRHLARVTLTAVRDGRISRRDNQNYAVIARVAYEEFQRGS